MIRRHPVLALLIAALLCSAGAVAVAQVAGDDGRIGPEKRLLNNGRQLTPYGKRVSVGQFPTGGALTRPTRVSEQYLLDLEREAFVSLCATKSTQERIAHMLKTGKPLRN